MNYKAITTLKKADTEGRVPFHTLDQYIRDELAQQLINALKPTLTVDRSDRMSESAAFVNQATVDFTTELILLKPHQWQQVKTALIVSLDSLSSDQQLSVQQVIREVDRG